MKPIVAAVFLTVFTMSNCKDSVELPESGFPECVGITESLNPYSIQKPYTGKIWGNDTIIQTMFIFTDFVNYNIIFMAERSWNMYIKFTSGTTTKYQTCWCTYSYGDNKYSAWSGFEYRGHHTDWDFRFENFTCSKLSGSCLVTGSETQDTLRYHFEGSR